MHFNRKGDLAISTNAIVVLIIAVIMLGLIIAFVQQGFGSVSDRFFGEVEKLPEPVRASASSPVTSSETTIVRQGEQFGMKISVFNTLADEAVETVPALECPDGVLSDDENAEQVNARDIATKTAHTFLYVNAIAGDAPVGKQLCQITAELDSDTTVSADVVLEVRE
jgi:hypothetical protein